MKFVQDTSSAPRCTLSCGIDVTDTAACCTFVAHSVSVHHCVGGLPGTTTTTTTTTTSAAAAAAEFEAKQTQTHARTWQQKTSTLSNTTALKSREEANGKQINCQHHQPEMWSCTRRCSCRQEWHGHSTIGSNQSRHSCRQKGCCPEQQQRRQGGKEESLWCVCVRVCVCVCVGVGMLMFVNVCACVCMHTGADAYLFDLRVPAFLVFIFDRTHTADACERIDAVVRASS